MRWWITMGSGGANKGWRRRGISVNFIRGVSNIFKIKSLSLKINMSNRLCKLTCWKYLSLLMYSRSVGSWSLLLRMYCHTALMMSGLLAVWMPNKRASLLVSLYWTGYTHRAMIEFKKRALFELLMWPHEVGTWFQSWYRGRVETNIYVATPIIQREQIQTI